MKCTQHSQSMSKEIEDLMSIEDGSQDLHGAIKDNMDLILTRVERMLDEWRLNVAICSDLENEQRIGAE